jgi:hypothetical protein
MESTENLIFSASEAKKHYAKKCNSLNLFNKLEGKEQFDLMRLPSLKND